MIKHSFSYKQAVRIYEVRREKLFCMRENDVFNKLARNSHIVRQRWKVTYFTAFEQPGSVFIIPIILYSVVSCGRSNCFHFYEISFFVSVSF